MQTLPDEIPIDQAHQFLNQIKFDNIKNKLAQFVAPIKKGAAAVSRTLDPAGIGLLALTRPPEEQQTVKKNAGYYLKALTGQPLTPEEKVGAKQTAEGVSGAVMGITGGVGAAENLTTKTLQKLEGRTTVSKQFIQDLSNQPELKQPERDLIRNILSEIKDKTVQVKGFANKVKSELLPLKRVNANTSIDEYTSRRGTTYGQRYEGIVLPNELRGPVANYDEHIYQSPIKTSAGSIHFDTNNQPNYFAHTRVEDLGSPLQGESLEGLSEQDISRFKKMENSSNTRRVIELQSDLFQKGNLEREGQGTTRMPDIASWINNDTGNTPQQAIKQFNLNSADSQSLETFAKNVGEANYGARTKSSMAQMAEMVKTIPSSRADEIAKLEPYRNTWHERVIREEVKQAAVDGKTKLQFPTGETAMKIEGLGEQGGWIPLSRLNQVDRLFGQGGFDEVAQLYLKPNELKPGLEVKMVGQPDNWVVTDVLGDGKFKAVPKAAWDSQSADWKSLPTKERVDQFIDMNKESFDISGKVDTNNPIYKFYEKEVGKYLSNKYAAQRITDPQGVQWWQVNVPKEAARKPIEAFGAVPFLMPKKQDNKQPKGGAPEDLSADVPADTPAAPDLTAFPDEIPVSEAYKYLPKLISHTQQTGSLLDELPDELTTAQAHELLPYLSAYMAHTQTQQTDTPEPTMSFNTDIGAVHAPQDTQPIQGRTTQAYGVPQAVAAAHEAIHHGVDIAAPIGTPVPTKVAGTVLQVQDDGKKAYGKNVIVLGADGVKRRYSHLSQFNVKQGQKITPGNIIGLVGATGAATGSHLDYREYF